MQGTTSEEMEIMVEGKRSLIRYRRRALQVVLSVTLLAMAMGCERNTYVPPPPPKVTLSHPLEKPVTDYLEFTGNTVAFQTVQLRARVEGYLEKVLFRDGDVVHKDKLLFLIQPQQYEADLQKAQSQVLAEKAQLEHAQTEYVRYSKLVKQQAAAQTDVDKWHYERDSRQAGLLAAKAQVELAKLNLSYTRVTAPFNGRMGRHLVDPGALVGAGKKTLLAEINQVNPIYVYFNINERDLLRVRGKNPPTAEEAQHKKYSVFVGLADEKGYPHKGYLDFAAITLNPTTGSLMLRAILRNPKYVILPGMFTRVRVPIAEPKMALLVPEVALGYDQRGPYVLIVNDQKVVERRGVQLGPKVDGNRVITQGLKSDEWVIVNGLMRAIPGRKVTPEKDAVPQAANAQPRASKTKPHLARPGKSAS
jgi:RND family efflux transporter MFP subunit